MVKIPHQYYRVKSNTQCLLAGWGSTKQCEEVNDLLALNVTTADICYCKEASHNFHQTSSVEEDIHRTDECALYETYRRDQVSAQHSSHFPILRRVV